jgi:hypothetical protein
MGVAIATKEVAIAMKEVAIAMKDAPFVWNGYVLLLH